MVHLLDQQADRLRIVVDAAPSRRRLFEALIPRDATAPELEAFFDELRRILTRRRASDQDITRNERGKP